MARNIKKVISGKFRKAYKEIKIKSHRDNIRYDIKNLKKQNIDFISDLDEENAKILVDAYNKISEFSSSQKDVYNTNLNVKQYFNYHYFSKSQPRCCMCGQILEIYKNDNDEEYLKCDIEHIFPKSKFPQLALCIDNWIPCCKECNQTKSNKFFNTKEEFFKALEQLGVSFTHPFNLWKNINLDFNSFDEIEINGFKECDENKEAFQLLKFYGLDQRFKIIRSQLYNQLFRKIKMFDINSPEALENFLLSEAQLTFDEISDVDFSFNNYPKIWLDFLDYISQDYNNITALWEELKEYKKFCFY
jgi:hypothetical protein